jgi:hypothetical protein
MLKGEDTSRSSNVTTTKNFVDKNSTFYFRQHLYFISFVLVPAAGEAD